MVYDISFIGTPRAIASGALASGKDLICSDHCPANAPATVTRTGLRSPPAIEIACEIFHQIHEEESLSFLQTASHKSDGTSDTRLRSPTSDGFETLASRSYFSENSRPGSTASSRSSSSCPQYDGEWRKTDSEDLASEDTAGGIFEHVHRFAEAARERFLALYATGSPPSHSHNVASPSPSISSVDSNCTGFRISTERHKHMVNPTAKRKPDDYYVRRAQERIRSQKPAGQPRPEDLGEWQREVLEALPSVKAAFWDNDFSFSYQPHFPTDLQMLAEDMEYETQTPSSYSNRMWPTWSSEWDTVLDDELTPQDPEKKRELSQVAIHAPRAVKPVNVAKMLEAGPETLESLEDLVSRSW